MAIRVPEDLKTKVQNTQDLDEMLELAIQIVAFDAEGLDVADMAKTLRSRAESRVGDPATRLTALLVLKALRGPATISESDFASLSIDELANQLALGGERAQWVAVSQTFMLAICERGSAAQIFAASDVAMRAVLASDVAMRAVLASDVAMRAVAASDVALRAICNSKSAREALIQNNSIFQSVGEIMYNTVRNSWTNTYSGSQIVASNGTTLNAPDNALVFACLGYYDNPSNGTALIHPGGTTAAQAASIKQPHTMASLDGVSFSGCRLNKHSNVSNYSYAYVVEYTPQ